MEVVGYAEDAVEVRLSRAEARAVYNLLVESESWPVQAVGPRPFIRHVREQLSTALDGFDAEATESG